MPLMWDARIEQARVDERLRQLGLPQTAIYALGCLTHSRDAVIACHSPTLPAFHPNFRRVAGLLDEFWSQYPQCLDETRLNEMAKAVCDLLPNEIQRIDEYSLAEDVWMDGVAFAFGLFGSDNSEQVALDALNALDRAYVFVYTFRHELDRINKSEAEICAAESTSKVCLDEMEFQLSLLTVCESLNGVPPPYKELLSLVGGAEASGQKRQPDGTCPI